MLLAALFSACKTEQQYVHPSSPDISTVKVSPIREVAGERHRPFVLIWLDDAVVNKLEGRKLMPVRKFAIAPGIHSLLLEIVAYNGNRAKYQRKAFEITFESRKNYQLDISIPESFSGDIEEDSYAIILMKDNELENVIYQESIRLKDNDSRSIRNLDYYEDYFEDIDLPTVITQPL